MVLVRIVVVLLSVLVIVSILMEGFETLVLPRRVERRGRMVKKFYVGLWSAWRGVVRRLPYPHQDTFLSTFGPLSLLLLIVVWAIGEVVAFACLHWAIATRIQSPEGTADFGTYLYLSATTFITLGFGDVAPLDRAGRLLADVEAGIGFGFLAIVIAYLPVLYTAFSRREVEIGLLDARASSPPSAGALLQRIGGCQGFGDLPDLLRDFERWAAELLESHVSYPVLMFYRSPHERQSWLAALTTILDTCAFLIAYVPDAKITWQARMTFAIARRVSVDLARVFDTPALPPPEDRLPPEALRELRELLRAADLEMEEDSITDAATKRLAELRAFYEPFVHALSLSLELSLPNWLPNPDVPDSWQTSAWDKSDNFFSASVQQPLGSNRFQATPEPSGKTPADVTKGSKD